MKKFIVLCLSLLLMLTSSYNVKAYSQPDDQQQIKDIVHEFLKNEIESIKIKSSIKSNHLIGNFKLREYSNLNNYYYSEWYKKLNNTLLDYELSINYDSIEISTNLANIFLSTDVYLVFSNDPDIKQGAFGNRYYFKLQKKSGKWFIENIVTPEEIEIENTLAEEQNRKSIYAEKDDFYKTNTSDKKLDVVKEKIKNIDNDLKKFKPTSNTKDKTKSSYISKNVVIPNDTYVGSALYATTYKSYSAAIDYARAWTRYAWDYNSDQYIYYDKADCTNFVSQCLYAGGYTYSNTWRPYNWEWVNVEYFYQHMTSTPGYGTPKVNYWDATLGDILQLKKVGGTRFSHSIIVTKLGQYGDIYFCAHSENRQDYSLMNVYPSSEYTDIRLIYFSYR